MDWLTTEALNGIGLVSFIVLMFVGFLRGWFVTGGEHSRIIHDRDEWRTESRLKDSQLAEKDRQLGHLAEVGRVVNNIMLALRSVSRDEEPR